MIRLYKKTKYGVVMLLVLAMMLQVAGPVVSSVYAEDGDIPVVEEPGTEEPGEPETGEPETGEPGTEEPGTEEPGTEEPGIPLTPLVPSTPVGPVEFQFITGISLTDGEGNGLGNNVSNKSEVHITYSFAIPDDYDIEADQIYDLTLPDEIEIINTITILLNANGQLMAKVVIDVDNNITITFTEYATNMSGISGSFKVETKFDEKEIGNGGSTEIEFDLGGNSTEKITVDFDTEPETVDVHLIKSGNYDKDNNVITWTVKVKPETKPDLRPISNVIITDVIQEGQTYVDGSVIITPTETNGNFNFEDGELTYAFVGDINIKENEEYIITFKKNLIYQHLMKKVRQFILRTKLNQHLEIMANLSQMNRQYPQQ